MLPSKYDIVMSEGHDIGMTGDDVYSEDGKRQRKAPVRFRPSIDIALMQSTLEHRALLVRYGNTKSTWDRVADAVNHELQKQNSVDVIDSRRCQDRMKRLMDTFRDHNFKLINKQSSGEEYKIQLDLLTQLVTQEDERKKVKRPQVDTGSPSMTSNNNSNHNTMDTNTNNNSNNNNNNTNTMLGFHMVGNNNDFHPRQNFSVYDTLPHNTASNNSISNIQDDENFTNSDNVSYERASKQLRHSYDEIIKNSHKATELFEKYLNQQQIALEHTRQLMQKQLELEERRIKIEEDKLAFARHQQLTSLQPIQQSQQNVTNSQPFLVSSIHPPINLLPSNLVLNHPLQNNLHQSNQ